MCLSPFFILALPQLHSVRQGYAWLFLGFSEHIGAMSGSSLASQRLSGPCPAFAQSHSACQGYTMPLLCGQYAALLRLCCVVVCYAVAHIDWYRYASPSLYIAVPGPVQLCRLPCAIHPVTFCRRTVGPSIASSCRCPAKPSIATALPDIGQSHSAVSAPYRTMPSP